MKCVNMKSTGQTFCAIKMIFGAIFPTDLSEDLGAKLNTSIASLHVNKSLEPGVFKSNICLIGREKHRNMCSALNYKPVSCFCRLAMSQRRPRAQRSPPQKNQTNKSGSSSLHTSLCQHAAVASSASHYLGGSRL